MGYTLNPMDIMLMMSTASHYADQDTYNQPFMDPLLECTKRIRMQSGRAMHF